MICSWLATSKHTLMQPEEYEKLGSFALIGLPDEEYPVR